MNLVAAFKNGLKDMKNEQTFRDILFDTVEFCEKKHIEILDPK